MKINELQIDNFLTIGHALLKLSDKGLVLIQGENLDDDSAGSNGAGKSSIPDALCWAIYGETARGVKGDSIINITAKKNTAVKVSIQDGTTVYDISRYRKHKENKNRLMIAVDGDDQTKGTDKLTQEYIEQLLGCSIQVFRAAVYAGQELMPDLPGMTDKELKTLVEEAAGIDKLQKAYEVAREKWRQANLDHVASLHSLHSAQTTLSRDQDDAEGQIVKRDSWEGERQAGALEIKKEAKALIVKYDEAVEEEGKFDRITRKAKLSAIKSDISGVDVEKRDLSKLENDAANADTNFKIQLAKVKSLKAGYDKVSDDVINIEHKVGESCGECGKTHTKEDLADLTKTTVAKKQDLAHDLKKEVVALNEYRDEAKRALEQATEFKASMTDITEKVEAERKLNEEETAHKTAEQKVADIAGELGRLNAKLKAKRAEENPWTATADKTLDRVTNGLKLVEELTDAAEQAEKKVALHEDAVEVFGQAGVRAHILDTVTPFLNARTSHYLSTLSDGNMTAEWSTLTTTTKGELREKFNIAVKNDKGADTFQGLSGGEKRKARLSAAMALQDMVASRASKPIELFIADEVDHALDEAGLERLMSILNAKATERGTVLVISHNELSDWIREQATVTKLGGFSTVSGALL